MKKILLHVYLWIVAPGLVFGQTLVDSDSFFNPDFRARRPGSPGVISLEVNNAVYRPASQSSGNVTWSHGAGGFAQAGVIAVGDVQLAAFSETRDDSLVFGRELTTSGALALLQPAVNSVVGANILSTWSSQATVAGLAIVPDQIYEVRFTVTSGVNLPVNLLDSMSFGITNPEVEGAFGANAQLIDLLGLVTLGTGSSSGDFAFQFTSSSALSSLDFDFEATSAVSLGLLGGIAGNQNVLTFSGFEVVAVPEPNALALGGVFASLAILWRKRRRG